MAYFNQKLRDRKGVALIITFFVLSILLVFVATFVSMSINNKIAADIFKRRTKAFYLAESGIDHAIFWLRSQSSPPVGDNTNPWGGTQTIGGGSYSVFIDDLGIMGGVGSTVRRYKITSTGTFDGRSRVISSYAQVDNYARYLWFTEEETFDNTPVWFGMNDSLDGPTHTNAHFHIYNDPLFGGEVSSVDDYIRFYNNGSNINLSQTTNAPYDEPVFQEGMSFGAEPGIMPSQALGLRSAASAGGFFLTGNTTVTLYNNGTMRVTNSKKKWSNKSMSIPANGALFVNKGTLTVSGTLNGNLTVGASSDVIIPSNIVYADDPIENPNSNDIFGIISEQDVVISSSAPYDLEIDGCVMAMGTSFMVDSWDSGSAKGTLTIYGGIIQDERGPIGTFSGSTGQKLTGYSKDYSHDPRLVSSPPPYMPSTGDYVILSWEEN